MKHHDLKVHAHSFQEEIIHVKIAYHEAYESVKIGVATCDEPYSRTGMKPAYLLRVPREEVETPGRHLHMGCTPDKGFDVTHEGRPCSEPCMHCLFVMPD